jgi:multiple sugar transport system substrate-binding protein
MKGLFAALLLALVAAGIVTYNALPEHGERPVLYWVVDTGEFREKQERAFEEWMVENGYPSVDLRIDASNRDPTKKVVQAVSGVGGDLIDAATGEIHLLQSIGVAEDLTDRALAMGFDVSMTYPATKPEMVIDGRQYGFPRNVGSVMLWSNLETFERAGLAPPPREWTFDEFEAIGRQFVEALNPPGATKRNYFTYPLGGAERLTLLRSMGCDIFNETLTASTFDHPATVRLFERFRKWTHEYRMIPSKEESQSLAGDSGGGPIRMHLFEEGRYGLMPGGRWALIYLRPLGLKRLEVSGMPYESFPNTRIGIGGTVMYKGSKNKDLAAYFFKFLASDRFNELMVDGADALPPVPAYAFGEAFTHPPDYPNEWGLHEPFREQALTTAIPVGMSPFILTRVLFRIELAAFERFMNGRLSAEDAVRRAAERINSEIERNSASTPSNAAKAATLKADQERIDKLKAAGRKIPPDLIRNPFHLKYYASLGWLTTEPEQSDGPVAK